jgi:hypothetical protein
MVTKICSKCKLRLPLSEFSTKTGERRHSWCKACNRVYQKAHYAVNVSTYKERAKLWRDQRRAEIYIWLAAYLEGHPCVDCDETDPIVLQFDHVRGEKIKDMSILMRDKVSIDVLEAEAAKCDIRCANCHLRRTARQFGWRRYLGAVDELGESAAFQAAPIAGSSPVCAAAG